ncbi:dynein heavy chain 3, axonemal [Cyclospora cayetanensis]|uniref:Dynein heavy chain 3, axonemal n=1 Tax=Cyclospora cayetanensis TaxID=88456 RepID=A0A6P6RQH3_9EIME|nr:dynein heavy chain 3, axonemal [Cyclospora cayetanensis]
MYFPRTSKASGQIALSADGPEGPALQEELRRCLAIDGLKNRESETVAGKSQNAQPEKCTQVHQNIELHRQQGGSSLVPSLPRSLCPVGLLQRCAPARDLNEQYLETHAIDAEDRPVRSSVHALSVLGGGLHQHPQEGDILGKKSAPLLSAPTATAWQAAREATKRELCQAPAAASTDYALMPPQSVAHVDSHNLSACPTNSTRTYTAVGVSAASFLRKYQRPQHRVRYSARRHFVVPRRRTFATFREWLAEDHQPPSKASGPREQFPARRGICHSASTDPSSGFLSAAIKLRAAVERRACQAVEEEVRDLSVSHSTQSQQATYVKAQQKALEAQTNARTSLDCTGRKKLAKAGPATPPGVRARVRWPLPNKLQKHVFKHTRPDAEKSLCTAAQSAIETGKAMTEWRNSSLPDISGYKGRDAMHDKPDLTSSLCHRHAQTEAAEYAFREAAAKAINAASIRLTRSSTAPSWHMNRPREQLRSSNLDSQEWCERYFDRGRPRESHADKDEEQKVPLDYLDGACLGSAEDVIMHTINPLEEALVSLQKIKKTESCTLSLTSNQGIRDGRNNGENGQREKQRFPAEGDAPFINIRKLPSTLLAGTEPSYYEGEPNFGKQRKDWGCLQHAPWRMKNLPLEDFDVPEDYGEACPQALLQRCHSDRQLVCPKSQSRNPDFLQETYSREFFQSKPTCHSDEAASCSLSESVASPVCNSGAGLAVPANRQQGPRRTTEVACTFEFQNANSSGGRGHITNGPAEHETEHLEILAPARENTWAMSGGDNTSEWMADAEVLHFVGTAWTHVPCRVLRYESDSRKFEVALQDGSLKAVRRLALRFRFETPQLHKQRLEACNDRRMRALLCQQLLRSVNRLPSSAFSPLPCKTVNCILKAATGIERFRHVGLPLEILVLAKRCLNERFLEAMKFGAVLHSARLLHAKGTLESYIADSYPQQQRRRVQHPCPCEWKEDGKLVTLLKVLKPLLSAAVPSFGRLDVGAADSFRRALVRLRKRPLFATSKTFKLSLLLKGIFCDLGGLSFFDLPSRKLQHLSFARVFKKSAILKPSEWTFPDPEQYLVYQRALAADVASALQEIARDSLCHALISAFAPLAATVAANGAGATAPTVSLQGTAASMPGNAGTARPKSSLRLQLNRFNIMLQSDLLSFVMDSANEWKNYMLRALDEKFEPFLQQSPASLPVPAPADTFLLKRNIPCLLQLRVIIYQDEAIFHPSQEEQVNLKYTPQLVEGLLRQALETMIEAVGTINKLEADLVPFAEPTEEPLLQLSREEPFLVAAREATFCAIRASLAEAEPLRKQLDEVACALRGDASLPFKENGGFDVQKLHFILQRYTNAETQLQKLSTRVAARMFVVDGAAAKKTLLSKVHQLRCALCTQALVWVENEVNSLYDSWIEALRRASAVPVNDEELIGLKKYLAEVHTETQPLITCGKTVSSLLTVLEGYFVFAPPKVQKQMFELECFSLRLKVVVGEASGILELAKERLEARRQITGRHLKVEFDALRDDIEAAAATFTHLEQSHTYMPLLETLCGRVHAAITEVENLHKAEGIFGLEASQFKQLEAVCLLSGNLNEVRYKIRFLWKAASDFQKNRDEWLMLPIWQLSHDEVEQRLQRWRQTASAVRRVAGVFQSVEPLHACDELLQAITSFQKLLPLIKSLTHPSFQAKHWQELGALLEVEPLFHGEVVAFSLNQLVHRGWSKATQAIKHISATALREFHTKEYLQNLRGVWRSLKIEFVALGQEECGRKTLKGFETIRSLIEEHQTCVNSLLDPQIRGEVDLQTREWLQKLSQLEFLCHLLESFQASWAYLVPIFDYPEIQQNLGKEYKVLTKLSKLWEHEVIGRLADSTNLLDFVDMDELPHMLQAASNELSAVKKSLNDFLDTKRLAFPRFWFCCNEELVQLLADAREAKLLGPHIQKCFEGIHSLQLDQHGKQAESMLSHLGEIMPLTRPIQLLKDGQTTSVEELFSAIESAMCSSLQQAMQCAWEEFPLSPSHVLWITDSCTCSQAALAIAHCCWTAQVEAAILQQQLPQLVKDLRHQLGQLMEAVRGPLSPVTRLALAAMMTLDVHFRDVVEELQQSRTVSIGQFEWVCHLRSYWILNGNQTSGEAGHDSLNVEKGRNTTKHRRESGSILHLCMLDSCLCYGFELLRTPERLVVTPLTERCYRTLMTAIHFHYGGALEGLAGTGKTETIKDLAKAAGKHCLVFNCNEGLDATAVAALLKGLATSGSWCSFGEFNRLELDVLSIVALQISMIQQAIRRRASTFAFEDTDLHLNSACSINITINLGYAGQSIIPDTLKALFRPCTMMIPDAALIAEVILYTIGFQDAHQLSRKMTNCLHLASEQLERRSHYDFGMRAVVAVLNTAGHLCLHCARAVSESVSKSVRDGLGQGVERQRFEAMVLCKALQLTNIPKLHPTDQIVFDEILQDVFNDGDIAKGETHHSLEPFLKNAARQLMLEPSKKFIEKTLQVVDTLEHRHGLMLVGASATGKTATVKCLELALELQWAVTPATVSLGAEESEIAGAVSEQARSTHGENEKCETTQGTSEMRQSNISSTTTRSYSSRTVATRKCICHRIFPKSIEVKELYGSFDSKTHEWKSGALEQAVRDASKEPNINIQRWIVLDGPVDVKWVECLNSVLDENKKLCLTSGEVVQIPPQMALLFEVTDLHCASPAAVSRCGIVYIHRDVLDWKTLLRAWGLHSPTAKLLGNTLAADIAKTLSEAFEVCWAFLSKYDGGPLQITPNWMILNVLRLFEAVVAQIFKPAQNTEGKVESLLEHSLEGALAFALLWGAGGTLSAAERPAFDVAFRSLHSGQVDVLERMGLFTSTSSEKNEEKQQTVSIRQVRRFKHHLPPTGSCFDVFWDFQQKKWHSWSSLPVLPDAWKDPLSRFHEVLIETPETALLEYFLQIIVAKGYTHFMLVGEAGSGKSKCMHHILQRMATVSQQQYFHQLQEQGFPVVLQTQGPSSGLIPGATPASTVQNSALGFLTLGLTGATAPRGLQQWIEARLEKCHGAVMRPSGFSQAVLLLDDVHLPEFEESGAQPAGEQVRQLVEFGGWNQHGTWRFHPIKGITISATCRSVRQQPHQYNKRLSRHFFPLMGVPYSPESLQTILHQLLLLRFGKCADTVVDGLNKVALLTRRLYTKVQQLLPPQPSRWMHHWTPRDCWRVVQRLAFLNNVNSHTQILCCWLHEVRAVFEDRIAALTDVDILSAAIGDVLKDTFHITIADLEPAVQSPLIFAFSKSEVRRAATDDGEAAAVGFTLNCRVYGRVTLLEAHQLCAAGLEQYSLLYPKDPLNLVLFSHAVEHVVRCMNTLLHPQGHLLLLGIGGSGRRSSARLAAFLAGFETVELHGQVQSPSLVDWQQDLKRIIWATGVLKKHLLLLVSPEYLEDKEIALDLCTLLQLREVPDVLAADEKAEALTALRSKISIGSAAGSGELDADEKGESMTSTSNPNMELLATECRQRLRVCTYLSPSDPQTQMLLRRFPALTGCCTVNYFRRWSAEALHSVARQKLQVACTALQQQEAVTISSCTTPNKDATQQGDSTESSSCTDLETRLEKLCVACTSIFESTETVAELYRNEQRRFFYVTPASFLRLLNTFCYSSIKQSDCQQNQQHRYNLGLQKLREVSALVIEMQHQLQKLQPELETATKEAEELRRVLAIKQDHVAVALGLVETQEKECKSQADAVALIERECTDQLAEATSLLLAAEEELKMLSKADITELKNIKTPPAGVVKVMEATSKLLGVRPVFVQSVPRQSRQADYWQTGKKYLLENSHFLQLLLNFDRESVARNVIAAVAQYEDDADFDPEAIKKASLAAKSLCLWVKALIAYDRANRSVKPRRVALQKAQSELQLAEALLTDKEKELLRTQQHAEELYNQYQQALQHLETIQNKEYTFRKRLTVAEKIISAVGGEQARWTEKLGIIKNQMLCIAGDAALGAALIEFGGAFHPTYRAKCLDIWKKELEKCGLKNTRGYSLEQAFASPQEAQHWILQGLPSDQFSIENAVIALNAQFCPMLIDPHQQAAEWLAHTFSDMTVLRAQEPQFTRSLQLLLQHGAVVVLECFSERLEPALSHILKWQKQRQIHLPCGDVLYHCTTFSLLGGGPPSTVDLGSMTVDVHPSFRLLLKTPLNAPRFSPELCSRLTLIDFSVGLKGLEQRLLQLALQVAAPDTHTTCLRLLHQEAEMRDQLSAADYSMLEALRNAKGDILEDAELLCTLRHAKVVIENCNERLHEQKTAQAAAENTLSLYYPVARRAAGLFQVLQRLESAHPMYLFSVHMFQKCFVEAVMESLGQSNATARQLNAFTHTADLVEAAIRRIYRSIYPCLFEKHKPLLPVLLALQSIQMKGSATPEEIQQLFAPVVGQQLAGVSPEESREDSIAFPEVPDIAWPTASSREKLKDLQLLGEPFLSVVSSMSQRNKDWKSALCCANPLATEWPENPQTALLQQAEVTHMRTKFVTVALGRDQAPKAVFAIRSGVENGHWVHLQNCHLHLGFLKELSVIVSDLATQNPHKDFRLILSAFPCDGFPTSILLRSQKLAYEPPRGLRQSLQSIYTEAVPAWIQLETALPKGELQLAPWSFLQHMASEINYGGRVTDERDRQLLRYLCHEALSEDGLWRQTGPSCLDAFKAPAANLTCAEILAQIKMLPVEEEPQVEIAILSQCCCNFMQIFGLQASAEIAVASAESLEIQQRLMAIHHKQHASTPFDTTPSGIESSSEVRERASVLLAQLPPIFNLEDAAALRSHSYENAMDTALLQELTRYNALIAITKKTLQIPQDAADGVVEYTDEVQNVHHCIRQNRVPQIVAAASYPMAFGLAAWMANLKKRVAFIKLWLRGPPPKPFWLPGCFNARSVCTAILQQFSRHEGLKLDAVGFNFSVLPDSARESSSSTTDKAMQAAEVSASHFSHDVSGLFLHGASWSSEDKVKLVKTKLGQKVENNTDADTTVLVLTLSLDRVIRPPKFYSCPLYSSSRRSGIQTAAGKCFLERSAFSTPGQRCVQSKDILRAVTISKATCFGEIDLAGSPPACVYLGFCLGFAAEGSSAITETSRFTTLPSKATIPVVIMEALEECPFPPSCEKHCHPCCGHRLSLLGAYTATSWRNYAVTALRLSLDRLAFISPNAALYARFFPCIQKASALSMWPAHVDACTCKNKLLLLTRFNAKAVGSYIFVLWKRSSLLCTAQRYDGLANLAGAEIHDQAVGRMQASAKIDCRPSAELRDQI